MADQRASRKSAEILPWVVRNEINRTIGPHLNERAGGHEVCSAKTRDERVLFAHRMVADLWGLGYRIRKLESLTARHVQALMTYWHEKGIVAGTLHTRLSMINVMCGWMGKRNVVHSIRHYLPEEAVKRRSVATKSKAWNAEGVDPEVVIEQARKIDERFGLMLSLQHTFGLRVKESIELKPANAVVDGGQGFELHEGTKGGKVRRVPIRSAKEREVIEWARRLAATGRSKRVRWPDRTWKQAQARFYYLFNQRLGITLEKMGISPHGLRHGWGQRNYEIESGGLPAPINGGALDRIDRETHHRATIGTSRALGHGRPDVTPTYCGSYGHQLRTAPATKVTLDLSGVISQKDVVKEGG